MRRVVLRSHQLTVSLVYPTFSASRIRVMFPPLARGLQRPRAGKAKSGAISGIGL